MKSNPILEEVWRVRRELERQAGDDLETLCEQTRAWTATHPLPGPLVEAADLVAWFERREAETGAATAVHGA